MRILASLMKSWQSEGIPLIAPETEASIRQAFARVGSRATSDVVFLYSSFGGMDEMDKEYWRLWSLAEVGLENPVSSGSGVLFSDYLMSCWSYRLRPNEYDTSSVLVDYFDGAEPSVVANTLEEFFEFYAANATLLLDAKSLAHVPTRDA